MYENKDEKKSRELLSSWGIRYEVNSICRMMQVRQGQRSKLNKTSMIILMIECCEQPMKSSRNKIKEKGKL